MQKILSLLLVLMQLIPTNLINSDTTTSSSVTTEGIIGIDMLVSGNTTIIDDRDYFRSTLLDGVIDNSSNVMGEPTIEQATIEDIKGTDLVDFSSHDIYNHKYIVERESKQLVGIKNGVSIIGQDYTVIPKGVKSIRDGVFQNKGLEGILIAQGLSSIGNNAFYGNNLSVIAFDDGIEDSEKVGTLEIGSHAFQKNQIKSIIPVISENNFEGTRYNNIIVKDYAFADKLWI